MAAERNGVATLPFFLRADEAQRHRALLSGPRVVVQRVFATFANCRQWSPSRADQRLLQAAVSASAGTFIRLASMATSSR